MPEDEVKYNSLKALNLAAEWATMATSDNILPEFRSLRPFIRLIGIALVSTSLTACQTTDSNKVAVESNMSSSASATADGLSTQPGMSDEQITRTYTDALRSTADSSVEVFSLDDNDMSAPYNGAADVAVAPVPQLPRGNGKAFGGDSNVMVFPLDGASTYGVPTDMRGEIPPMIPPGGPTPLTPGPLDQSQAGAIDGVPRIYFSHGAVGVNNAGKQVTASVANQCRTTGCSVVKVEGHASTRAEAKDEVQRRMINLKVSMDRAMNVMRQLVRDGVPPESIQVTAHGDRVPPVAVPSGDTEAAARRVEILTGSSYPQY